MDFLNTKKFSEYILHDIYDVDEFILNLKPLLDKDDFEFYDIRDFMKRKSFIRFKDYKFIGNKRTNQIQISKKEISNSEYTEHRGVKLINDSDGCGFEYCSTLNYKDFKHEPLLNFIDAVFTNRETTSFTNKICKWIEETNGDEKIRIRLNDLLERIKQSQKNLKNLKSGWGSIIVTPLNPIQQKVIEIHKKFNTELLKQLNDKYQNLISKNGTKNKDLKYNKGFKLNAGYGSRSNLNNVLEHLKDGGFIEKNTSFNIFKNAFNPISNKEIETPIEWKGNIDELYYFISNLTKKKVINNERKNYNKHIIYSRAVFTKNGEQVTKNITGNHDTPKRKQELDNIISLFKKEKTAVQG